MNTRYVVKDENTLGYIFDHQLGIMGVLASKIDGHDPKNGSIPVSEAEIRIATKKDFETFRVCYPEKQ